MEIDTNEIMGLLEDYLELEEKVKFLTRTKEMSQDILKESPAYRSFLNTQYELKRYFLNGEDIIKLYKNVRNIAEQKNNSNEEEYKSKINDLEEKVSNLKDSRDNLKKLILDYNNFFNGKIIEEIKKES
ncbi:MAG: hypothetical protein AABX44_00190 [Nanoarchaeota archaeon]